ncbi:MAG: EAL domain-containing response regulator [Acidimicrobiia bacterium]
MNNEAVPRVLVVDDDEMIRRLFVRALTAAGLDVREATNGEEGLAAVHVHEPDVVLLDSRMPRMDGLEVLARLRADPATRGIAVVMVTGSGDLDDRVAGLEAGADDYVTKPLHVDELVARVRAQLRRVVAATPDDVTADSSAVARIHAVIEQRAHHPVFQPIVRLADRHVTAYEALSRFDDGRGPAVWFDEAHAAGVRGALEMATLLSSVAGARHLPAGRALSVNVSCTLLGSDDLVDVLRRVDRPLVLELTEHERVDDYDAVRERLAAIEAGLPVDVVLAVDDAGAGFASLRHILDLAPGVIKLDLSWIRAIDLDPPRQTLVAGLVRFAEETGAVTVAEGIETEAEERVVRGLGVVEGQGYRLGRPARAEDLAQS